MPHKDLEQEIETVLHQFALNYRVESRETRKEDIALAKSKLEGLYKERFLAMLPEKKCDAWIAEDVRQWSEKECIKCSIGKHKCHSYWQNITIDEIRKRMEGV